MKRIYKFINAQSRHIQLKLKNQRERKYQQKRTCQLALSNDLQVKWIELNSASHYKKKPTNKLNTTSKLEQQQPDQKIDEMDGKTPISQHSESEIETESQKTVITVPTSQYIVNINRKKLEKNFKLQGITGTTK
ncbi:Hypothetical_protein [Hexamita inflata]|uniref:Hypothetical_protein n=1 Tax=Hexamita inflata TaxID=28002 RepID=A0ABP1LPI9_9EUKA